ncbi:hypothetical protein ACUGAJ_001862 [Klebsiella pneumoniae]
MHHADPALKAVIEACDRAISQEDYDTLMSYYAEDAAMVIMETRLDIPTADGISQVTRRATYVFQKQGERWLCTVDNSYGTDLLDD